MTAKAELAGRLLEDAEYVMSHGGWSRQSVRLNRNMREAAAALTEAGAGEARVRHKKRGTEYEVLGIGRMQAEKWRYQPFGQNTTSSFDEPVDMREVVIYRSVDDGQLWVRPREEFEDGRFEALTAPPSAAFKAGWFTNAAYDQPVDYLNGCLKADWVEYQKKGLDRYVQDLLNAAREEADAEQPDDLRAEVERLRQSDDLYNVLKTALEHASFALDGVVALDDEDEGKDGGSKTCQHAKRTVDRALKKLTSAREMSQ